MERKEYEDCQSLQECVDELVRRTIRRVEQDMPEKGKFSDIFELFLNPDKRTADEVWKYGLHIFKMDEDIVPDPTKRFVQASAYILSASYKATLMCGSGTKTEIIAMLSAPSFPEELIETFAELLETLRDI
jgi:hypothetical protein